MGSFLLGLIFQIPSAKYSAAIRRISNGYPWVLLRAIALYSNWTLRSYYALNYWSSETCLWFFSPWKCGNRPFFIYPVPIVVGHPGCTRNHERWRFDFFQLSTYTHKSWYINFEATFSFKDVVRKMPSIFPEPEFLGPGLSKPHRNFWYCARSFPHNEINKNRLLKIIQNNLDELLFCLCHVYHTFKHQFKDCVGLKSRLCSLKWSWKWRY